MLATNSDERETVDILERGRVKKPNKVPTSKKKGNGGGGQMLPIQEKGIYFSGKKKRVILRGKEKLGRMKEYAGDPPASKVVE